jgi:polyhydroxyalkanoate synthesis regulator phasin
MKPTSPRARLSADQEKKVRAEAREFVDELLRSKKWARGEIEPNKSAVSMIVS